MTSARANGILLEYEAMGKPDNPAIVLVRGLGTQLIDWPGSLLENLVDEGFRVVVFDNRDTGLSQKFTSAGVPDLKTVMSDGSVAPYDLSDMAGDIVGLMDHLRIEEAHVLGISLGGMIVQVLAAEHPGRLLSMMSVMSSSSRPGLPGPTEEAAALVSPGPESTIDEAIELAARGLEVYGSPGYPLSPDERIALARQRYERDFSPDGEARQMAAAVATGNREEMLRRVRVPALVIHGRDDTLIPVEAGIDTAECIPDCALTIIDGMGHNIPPALVPVLMPHIVGFCREHTP